MSNFIIDGTSLPGEKDEADYLTPTEYNTSRQALLDVQTVMRDGGYLPVVFASGNAGQSIASLATAIIAFSTADVDTASAVTPGASWVFIVPSGQGGLYRVSSAVSLDLSGGGGDVRMYVTKNGSIVLGAITAAPTGYHTMKADGVIELAAGDGVSISIVNNTGGARTVMTEAYFTNVSIHRIGMA